MNNIQRALKHLFTTSAAGRRAFPAHALAAIERAIALGETQHRGEVRLIVEPALDFNDALRGMSARERAIELFSLYKIWDTEENCGVLIYINLADHKVEIIADRGISRLIGADEWQRICRTMTAGFAKGDYQDSSEAALTELNQLLRLHFPDTGTAPNQLPNRPMML